MLSPTREVGATEGAEAGVSITGATVVSWGPPAHVRVKCSSCLLHPSSPLERKNNENLEILPGARGRAGALQFQCLLKQEGAESLGPRKTSSRSPWKPASPWPSLYLPPDECLLVING